MIFWSFKPVSNTKLNSEEVLWSTLKGSYNGMHFFKLIVLKCVLAVPIHNHHIMLKIHPVFLF